MTRLSILIALGFILTVLGLDVASKQSSLIKCDAKSRCKDKPCAEYVRMGCLCYNNGSCINKYVNYCQDCENPDVYSVNEDGGCPEYHNFGDISQCEPSSNCKCE